MNRHDATLDDALDLKAAHALPRGVALLLALLGGALLFGYGYWAKANEPAKRGGHKPAPPTASAKPDGH